MPVLFLMAGQPLQGGRHGAFGLLIAAAGGEHFLTVAAAAWAKSLNFAA
jgi:hypothetical protein